MITPTNMSEIPFTQFLRPDGRRRAVMIERPPEINTKAMALIAQGFVFEIEMLRTGDIIMEILNRETEEVLAHEICANGPEVPLAVDRMVEQANDRTL